MALPISGRCIGPSRDTSCTASHTGPCIVPRVTKGSPTSLPGKLLRRVRQGDFKNTAYLTYYHSYLLLRDRRLGTRFAGSTKASDLGGSDAESTGNFPAHPRIAKHLLGGIPDPQSHALMDVGCGSGSVLRVALDLGFKRVDGIELFPQAAAIAHANLDDPRTQIIVGDALKADFSGYDVICLYRPFPMLEEYEPLISRSSPQWLLLMHLDAFEPEGYEMVRSYRHPVYEPFTGRLLKKVS